MFTKILLLDAVLRIDRNRRIHMFLGLLDPKPDPLIRGADPDPSIIKAKIVRKTLIPTDLSLLYDRVSHDGNVVGMLT
jgi:hypothetical protein